jgi:hypothetical protein
MCDREDLIAQMHGDKRDIRVRCLPPLLLPPLPEPLSVAAILGTFTGSGALMLLFIGAGGATGCFTGLSCSSPALLLDSLAAEQLMTNARRT